MSLIVTSFDWPFHADNANKSRFDDHYTFLRDDFPGIRRVVLGEPSVDGRRVRDSLHSFTTAEIAIANHDFAYDLECFHLDDLRLILCEQPHPEDNDDPECECQLQFDLMRAWLSEIEIPHPDLS